MAQIGIVKMMKKIYITLGLIVFVCTNSTKEHVFADEVIEHPEDSLADDIELHTTAEEMESILNMVLLIQNTQNMAWDPRYGNLIEKWLIKEYLPIDVWSKYLLHTWNQFDYSVDYQNLKRDNSISLRFMSNWTGEDVDEYPVRLGDSWGENILLDGYLNVSETTFSKIDDPQELSIKYVPKKHGDKNEKHHKGPRQDAWAHSIYLRTAEPKHGGSLMLMGEFEDIVDQNLYLREIKGLMAICVMDSDGKPLAFVTYSYIMDFDKNGLMLNVKIAFKEVYDRRELNKNQLIPDKSQLNGKTNLIPART